MEVQEAVETLQASGLMVGKGSLGDKASIHVARKISAILDDGTVLTLDVARIYSDNGQWWFHKWDYCPGPGDEDIIFPTESLAAAVRILLLHYFGEPTIHNQWLIPLHKHPEWELERLFIALQNAKRVTPEAWRIINEDTLQCYLQLHGRLTLPQTFAYMFCPIPNIEDPNLTLHLRRDLEEAYIVRHPLEDDDI